MTLSSFCSKHILQTHCTLQKSAGQPLEAAPIPPESLNQQHADTLWDRMIKTAIGGHWSCPDSVSPAQSPYAMQASPASTNGTKHQVTMYFQVTDFNVWKYQHSYEALGIATTRCEVVKTLNSNTGVSKQAKEMRAAELPVFLKLRSCPRQRFLTTLGLMPQGQTNLNINMKIQKERIKILVGVFGFPGCHQEEDAEECWRIRQRGYDLNRTSSQIPSSAIRMKLSSTKDTSLFNRLSVSLSICLPGCFLQSGL